MFLAEQPFKRHPQGFPWTGGVRDLKGQKRNLFNLKEDLNVLQHQPIISLEIEPIRSRHLRPIIQSDCKKTGDFFYVPVRTIYTVTESSLAFCLLTDHDHVHLQAFYFHYPRPITLLISMNQPFHWLSAPSPPFYFHNYIIHFNNFISYKSLTPPPPPIFPIFSLFNLLFLCIFHLFSHFNLLFFGVFHIISLFN